jgi:hypothetical protein
VPTDSSSLDDLILTLSSKLTRVPEAACCSEDIGFFLLFTCLDHFPAHVDQFFVINDQVDNIYFCLLEAPPPPHVSFIGGCNSSVYEHSLNMHGVETLSQFTKNIRCQSTVQCGPATLISTDHLHETALHVTLHNKVSSVSLCALYFWWF